ncbi:hypothetical protein NLJ89_g8710 [Agrocybe chaxingu]|uniref:Uncharacterized protein n=1 Tax=Agrocybe chaxingu TaxID=84603 RepID=A0A9W8JUY0_9AGAR|nr:hypothetical protein NLJ89_g8710 [Agrocybe chaxingu]
MDAQTREPPRKQEPSLCSEILELIVDELVAAYEYHSQYRDDTDKLRTTLFSYALTFPLTHARVKHHLFRKILIKTSLIFPKETPAVISQSSIDHAKQLLDITVRNRQSDLRTRARTTIRLYTVNRSFPWQPLVADVLGGDLTELGHNCLRSLLSRISEAGVLRDFQPTELNALNSPKIVEYTIRAGPRSL